MPIKVGIWKIGNKIEPIGPTAIALEKQLEDAIERDLSIIAPDLMLIGRQIPTPHGKYIDLLAMNTEGNLVVIENKRGRASRDVVGQVLDYASWVRSLSYDDISRIYEDKNKKKIEEGIATVFGDDYSLEEINQKHQLIVVATELDHDTERIINYLSDDYQVPINAVFFSCFEDEGKKYLTRTWLIDPNEVERKTGGASVQKGEEPWNGHDFYINCTIEDNGFRHWDDCRKYGFVSGGTGRWYSDKLKLLFPGARVFAHVRKEGYVGVGKVIDTVMPAKDFMVEVNGQRQSILDAPKKAKRMGEYSGDIDNQEYVVPVEWIKQVPVEQAYREKGFFASQHTACRLRNRFTLERLVKHFKLED